MRKTQYSSFLEVATSMEICREGAWFERGFGEAPQIQMKLKSEIGMLVWVNQAHGDFRKIYNKYGAFLYSSIQKTSFDANRRKTSTPFTRNI